MNTTSTTNAGGAVGTDWDRLSLFRITVEDQGMVIAPVFADGRQQIPFLIEIIAEKNGKTVKLTDSQLKGITLVEYGKDGPVPDGLTLSYEKSPQSEYKWALPRLGDRGFEQEKPAPRDPSTMGQVQLLWVSCTRLGKIKVAARILSPSGVWIATNTPPLTMSKFDSWVVIDGRDPKDY